MSAIMLLVSPPLFASASDGVSYADMKDAELTQTLTSWGTLHSSERRELLVELKKRMERSQELQAQTSARQTRAPRITIRIHVRKTMRFGAGVTGQVGHLRSGGLVVMRGGMNGTGDAPMGARAALEHMRRLIANSEPLPGPGFGDGYERRQAYLRASFDGEFNQTSDVNKLLRASASALTAGQVESHLRDK